MAHETKKKCNTTKKECSTNTLLPTKEVKLK